MYRKRLDEDFIRFLDIRARRIIFVKILKINCDSIESVNKCLLVKKSLKLTPQSLSTQKYLKNKHIFTQIIYSRANILKRLAMEITPKKQTFEIKQETEQ